MPEGGGGGGDKVERWRLKAQINSKYSAEFMKSIIFRFIYTGFTYLFIYLI